MKIDGSIKSTSTSAAGAGGARSSGKGTPSKPSSGGGASVQLSPLSAQMQAIESGMAGTPVVNSARVAEIRQAIADGRFKVNPNVVADHLLQTARELMKSGIG